MKTKIKMLTTGILLYVLGFTSLFAQGQSINTVVDKLLTKSSQEINQGLSPDTTKTNLDTKSVEIFTDGMVEFARQDLNIPGVVISVVNKEELIFSKGYGWADETNKIPVSPENTRFAVASISKTFTYTALMQLVESRMLSLDDEVAKLLDFAELDQNYSPITVKQLMTHSAGFEDRYLGEAAITDSNDDMPLQDYIRRFMPKRVRPGDQYIVYNNYGTALAGAVIEKVSGLTFEDYMQQNIFIPLGMGNSTFIDSKIPAEGDANRAVGHQWYGGRYLAERENYHQQGLYPAAGLKTTAVDMAKFMLLHLPSNNSIKPNLLKPETLTQMHRVIKRNHPKVAGNAHGFWRENIAGYTSISHGGNTKGFKSELVMIPELELGIFISTNSVNGNRLTNKFTHQLVKTFFPQKANITDSKQTRTNVAASNQVSQFSNYAGLYLPMRRNYSTIERMTASPIYVAADKSKLSVFTGNHSVQLRSIGLDVFIEENSGEQIAFETGHNGQVKIIRDANVYEKIGFLQNANNLLSFLQLLMFIALIVLLMALINWLRKRKQTKQEALFEKVLLTTATLWLAFYVCLSLTIASFEGAVTPAPLIKFPDTATIIGQWLLIASIICLFPAFFKLKSYWKSSQRHWLEKSFSSVFISLLSFVLLWSTEFNMIGFQY